MSARLETHLKSQPLVTQLFDLLLIQLSNWRWSWRSMLVVSTFGPVLSTVALGFFARGAQPASPQTLRNLEYILTGNLVLALMFETVGKVSSNFSWMRARGMFDYFASLPIQRYSLIIATVLAFLVLSLPALVITMVFGAIYLGLPVSPSLWLLLVIPLAALPLAGIGALIGVLARTPEECNSLSLLVTFGSMALGPVLIPPERLPAVLQAAGWLSPATYAASALRQALLGPLTPRLGVDLLVLAGITLLVLWLVARQMDWRQK